MEHDKVVEIMEQDAGTLLDPDLLKVFLDHVVSRDGRGVGVDGEGVEVVTPV
jgi:HD-GYP domain-containing protein (c-di-GMP phosphodiesterase class II)